VRLAGALGTLLFVITLSFLFTTPGIGDTAAGGFPALSRVGEFLIKDIVLLGASILAAEPVADRHYVRRPALIRCRRTPRSDPHTAPSSRLCSPVPAGCEHEAK